MAQYKGIVKWFNSAKGYGFDDLVLLVSLLAAAPWFLGDKEEGAVTGLNQAQQAEANDAGGVLNAWSPGENCLDLSRRRVGPLERS